MATRASRPRAPRAASAPSSTTAASPRFLARLNAGASRHARIEYLGSRPFGARPIECYRLGNGLRVLVLADDNAPVVSYHTWYRVGSRHEIEGKTGLAHLFEHLMFNETRSLPAGEFDRLLEHAGASTNAATWFDWTYYHSEAPREALRLLVRLEADRMRNLVLRQPQVTSETEVVANERRLRVDDDVEGTVNEVLYKIAYDEHPYKHPTIGWMADILKFTPADCRQFYKRFYAPNNATVVVVGDVDPARLLALIQKEYGAFPPSVLPTEAPVPSHVMRDDRLAHLRRSTPTSRVGIGYLGAPVGSPDYAAMLVLNDALFGGRSARIYRELVTRREVASDVVAASPELRDGGLWEISATARDGIDARTLLAALDAELDRLASEPLTVDERDRAVARIELGALQDLQTVSGRAEQIGLYDTLVGNPAGALEVLEAVRRVDVAALESLVARYVQRDRRAVVLLDPGAEDRAQDVAS